MARQMDRVFDTDVPGQIDVLKIILNPHLKCNYHKENIVQIDENENQSAFKEVLAHI